MKCFFYSFLISVFFLFFIDNFATAQERPFKNTSVAYDANLFEKQLQKTWETTHRKRWADQVKSYEHWIEVAKQAKQSANLALTQEALWAALILNAADTKSWLALAEGYVNIDLSDDKKNQRRAFAKTASSAAYLGYARAKSPKVRARALLLLAQSLVQRSFWRPALEAYKSHLSLNENEATRTVYNDLNAQYGFRVTNYKVDSDTENPRICLQFSEQLATGKIDFSKYISLNGKDPQSLTREDWQLCVDGLLHGQRYDIRVREGLPAKIDEAITKTSQLKVYVRDRSPAVRASGKTYVLPRTGQNGIPLISVNTDKLKIDVHRVGDRALSQTMMRGYLGKQFSGYDVERLERDLSQKIWSGEMAVKSQLNKDVSTAFPVNEILEGIEPGLYVLYATAVSSKKIERFSRRASQWFVVSDIGLTSLSSAEGMTIFVRSLATAEPLKGLNVKLLARNNDVLGTGETDRNGRVTFNKGAVQGLGAQSPYIVVAEQKDKTDYGFLDVASSAFDLTDRGVSGRQSPGPLDAYIFSERGVYRPGEQVHLTGLLRDQDGLGVPKLPLTLIISRPDGVEHDRMVWHDEGQGGRSHSLALPDSAMSGTWRARVYTDPKASPIGIVSFLVEDYTPQRLELSVTPSRDVVAVGEQADLKVSGRYLYGAPASNLQLDGEVILRKSTKGFKAFPGYLFGLHDEKFLNVTTPLSALPRTSRDGTAQLSIPLLEVQTTNHALEAEVVVRMTEPGGRSISEQVQLTVQPLKPLLGIKPLFQSGQLGQGDTAKFDIITVGTNGKQSAVQDLKWELFEVEQRFQWYNRNGSWNFETVSYTKKVSDGVLNTKKDAAVTLETAVRSGRYRLDVSSAQADGPVASYVFNAGWYSSAQTDTPDILDLSLDKASYDVGETMSVTLNAQGQERGQGKALVAIVDTKIREMKLVDVGTSPTKVDFKVGQDWGAGTYVTAFLYRPMDEKIKRMPSRSLGIAWVKQKKTAHTLKLSLDTPDKIRPNSVLTVPVKLNGLKPGVKTYVTLAAVDEGILNLTKFQSPNPGAWYYGQRQIGTEMRDLYGKLIDGMQVVRGKIRSGGDGFAGLQTEPPKNIEPVALYSGLITVDDQGMASVSLDIPAFDGSLRLMAVAWNDSQVGSAEKDIIVRDPVVVIGTAPRFLTMGDQSNLHLSLDNVEGPSGEYAIQITGTGPVEVEASLQEITLQLDSKDRKDISIPLKALEQTGIAQLNVALSGPDDFSLERTFAFNVHPIAPNVTRRFVLDIEPNGGKVSIGKDLLTDLMSETVKVSLSVNRGTAFDVPGMLLALNNYPYACAEQTTSKVLPLLYLSSTGDVSKIAEAEGISVKDRIEQAITHLSSLQLSNGAFGLWGPFNEDLWLTAYVADFLSRAQAQGYTVSKQTFELALDRLQNAISYAPDFKNGGEGIAYALHVLARNGRAGIGDLRYYADAKLDDFATGLAQAQLGAALAMYGDKTRAEQAYTAALKRLQPGYKPKNNRIDYGSPMRDGAAMLTLVAETPATRQLFLASLTDVLEGARQSQNLASTQENAWMLLAAHALKKESKDIKLLINGKTHLGALQRVMGASQFQNGDMSLTNQTDRVLKAAVTITGDGRKPEAVLEKGFRINRQVYTLDGQPSSLEQVKQNERFVVVLTAEETEAKRARLILVDRLPAGFEIENPRLVTSSSTKRLSWLKTKGYAEHTEFKDDKFMAAFNIVPKAKKVPQSVTVAYIVRAVSPGRYMHPAATIEDMYRPERMARTDVGNAVILQGN